MNLNPLRSITEQLGRLSVSISRAASARQASTSAVKATAATTTTTTKPKKEVIPTKFEPGHGEKIWIFTNFISGLTVYSHNPVLKVRFDD